MAKIIFVQDVLFDYHGIEVLSALLKKNGHDVDVFITDAEKEDLLEYLKREKPDVIAFSISSTDYSWAEKIAGRIKKQMKALIVFGGPHPTYFPEFIKRPFADIICIGEGEYATLELMNAIERGEDYSRIRNLWVKKGRRVIKNPLRNLIEDLDELPIPDRKIYFKYKFLRETPVKRFAPSRGCPYNCTYCYNQCYKQLYRGKGTYTRYRSPAHVIEEMKMVRDCATMEAVSIVSDTFTTYKKWMADFLELYKKEIGLPFYCQARYNEIDEDTVRKLREAGCNYVALGVESGNPRVRNLILKKNITNEQIIEGSRLIKKYGLKLLTFNMFCLPTETLEEALDTVRINAKIRADVMSSTILQPTPGTQIFDFIFDNGLFEHDVEPYRIAGHYEDSPIRNPEKRDIMNLHKLAYLGVRFPASIPLLKMAIKLPPNPIFNLIFKLTLLIRYKESRSYSWIEMVRVGWNLRKFA